MREDIIGREAVGRDGRRIGRIVDAWDEQPDRPAMAAVRGIWTLGSPRLVPLADARVDEQTGDVWLGYPSEAVRGAPSIAAGDALDAAGAQRVLDHYLEARGGVEHEIPLHAERVEMDKRVEPIGAVRLRKVVRREVVYKPVEVLREEVVVERLKPDEVEEAERRAAGRDDEIVMRQWGEVPVVEKFTERVGTAVVRRDVAREVEHVAVDRRVEDLDVERHGFDERL